MLFVSSRTMGIETLASMTSWIHDLVWHGHVFGFFTIWIWPNWKVEWKVTLMNEMFCIMWLAKNCQKWRWLVIVKIWKRCNSLFTFFLFLWCFVVYKLWTLVCCSSWFDIIQCWFVWCFVLCLDNVHYEKANKAI